MSEWIKLADGKYEVKNNNGLLQFRRYGEDWAAPNELLSGVVLAMVHEIERLRSKERQE